MTDSEPLPRSLLRLFDAMPGVELVGVAGDKLVSPKRLAELQPDLLLVNIGRRQKEATKLYEYLSRQLPHCSTLIFSKQDAAEEIMASFARRAPLSGNDSRYMLKTKSSAAEKRFETTLPNDVANGDTLTTGWEYIDRATAAMDDAKPSPGFRYSATLRERSWGLADRRKAQGERRHSEVNRTVAEQFESFVEQFPGMPYIAHLRNDVRTIYISPKIRELLGFTPEQWCSDPALRIGQLHADDRDTVMHAIRQAVDAKQGYCLDYRIHAYDGSVHWFHDEARVMMDDRGTPALLQGVVLDITERKQAQEELEKSHRELQELIVALDSLRAEEQKRLAHEMHDDFGQLLMAIKLDLCTLQQRLPPENSEACKYLSSINELVDTMVTSVRRIIADLPPKLVEDLGLFHALRGLAKNFEQRHHIHCTVQIPENAPELPPRISTALYRIVQEALNNVAKHANATSVRIGLHCCGTNIGVGIVDNGRGMPTHGPRKAGSFGLISMRERALALGGQMKIKSQESQGTAVEVSIPLNA